MKLDRGPHAGGHQAWIPVLYQYLVGGVVFALGIWLILAKGSCIPGRGDDRFWLAMLVIGFFVYMGMFKGAEPNFEKGVVVRRLHLDVVEDADLESGHVWLPSPVMEALRARDGDLIYIADDRRILAGLRSVKLTARLAPRQDPGRITLHAGNLGDLLPHRPVYVEKLL